MGVGLPQLKEFIHEPDGNRTIGTCSATTGSPEKFFLPQFVTQDSRHLEELTTAARDLGRAYEFHTIRPLVFAGGSRSSDGIISIQGPHGSSFIEMQRRGSESALLLAHTSYTVDFRYGSHIFRASLRLQPPCGDPSERHTYFGLERHPSLGRSRQNPAEDGLPRIIKVGQFGGIVDLNGATFEYSV